MVPEKFGAEYYRSFLTKRGKSFYDRINRQLLEEDYSGKIVFNLSPGSSSSGDAFAAYKAIRDDHPEFFFLDHHSEFISSRNTGTLKYTVLYPPQEIRRIRLQLRKTIFRIVRGTAERPEEERERVVYERIAKKMSYTNHYDARDHNVVGPVLLSNGVCEGQNALLMLCLRRVGIPCIKVYGKTKDGGSHCWTMAWVNGIPVHCDVTWDRAVEGCVRYNYLNLSDKQIGADHFDFSGERTPVSSSDRMSYYRYNGLCVRSSRDLDRQVAASDIGKDKAILLHFDYKPPKGDYIAEISGALNRNNIRDKVVIYTHESTNNFAIIKT